MESIRAISSRTMAVWAILLLLVSTIIPAGVASRSEAPTIRNGGRNKSDKNTQVTLRSSWYGIVSDDKRSIAACVGDRCAVSSTAMIPAFQLCPGRVRSSSVDRTKQHATGNPKMHGSSNVQSRNNFGGKVGFGNQFSSRQQRNHFAFDTPSTLFSTRTANGLSIIDNLPRPRDRMGESSFRNSWPFKRGNQDKDRRPKRSFSGNNQTLARKPRQVLPPAPIRVEGNSLKTWSFLSPSYERVRINLETDGRPLNAEVDCWVGPDNTPYKMRAYVENGLISPLNVTVELPSGTNTIAVRNVGAAEFPIFSNVAREGDNFNNPARVLMDPVSSNLYTRQLVQGGGAVRSFPFDSFVENVQILLISEGRPVNARVELLQGPNNVKQIIEFYADDGLDRPLFAVIETPGSANVIRIVNTAPLEYPLVAWVEPLMVGRPRHDESGGFIVNGVVEPWHEVAGKAGLLTSRSR